MSQGPLRGAGVACTLRCSILVRRDNEVHGPEPQIAIARGRLRLTNVGEALQQRLHPSRELRER